MADSFAERPTPLVTDGVHDRHPDDTFEFLEPPHNNRSMCPGAGPGDIKVVATTCSRIVGTSVRGHPVRKGIRLPGEDPFDALFVWKLCLNGHGRSLVFSTVPHLPRLGHGEGMESDDLVCSPGTRARLGALAVGRMRKLRAVEDQSAPFPERKRASLEGSFVFMLFDTRSRDLTNRLDE